MDAVTTITIVDDDPDFTSLVGEILRDRGWDVVVCLEEDDALRCIEESSPHLIVMDVRMKSRESGWRILEQLERNGTTRSVPVIVCSAAIDDLQRRDEWMRSRGIVPLPKPFDIDDLLTLVHRLLPNGSPSGC